MLKLKSAILLLIFCLSCPCSSLPLFLSSCRLFEPYFDLLTELLSISFCIVSIVGIFQYTQKTCYHLLVSVFNTFSEVWKSFTNKMWLLFLPHVSNIIFNIIWCFFFLSHQIVFIKLKKIRLVACRHPCICSFSYFFLLLDAPRFFLLSLPFCWSNLIGQS